LGGQLIKDLKQTRFDFNDEEISMMRGILETYLHDLTAEISSTEKLSFREDLKKEKNFILQTLGRIDKKGCCISI
jgi:hypothetical protein